MVSIKSKILNHLLLHGKKKTSEKILLQSFKELQKFSAKQSTRLIRLAVARCTSVFKIQKQTRKKNRKRKHVREIPTIIISKKARISLAIKFILRGLIHKNLSCFYAKFYTGILSTVDKGSAISMKNEIQKQLLIKKHFFFNYR